jgi:hypothetical protein
MYLHAEEVLQEMQQWLDVDGVQGKGLLFDKLDQAEKIIIAQLEAYRKTKEDIVDIERRIHKDIYKLYDHYREKDLFIKDRLFAYYNNDRKIRSRSEMESLLEVIDRKARTLDVELRSIRAEEEIVTNEILRYANHVLQELRSIDKRSSIKHLGKTQRMMEIHIPEEKEEESLKEYIRDRVEYFSGLDSNDVGDGGNGNGKGDKDYKKQLEADINSAELLSKLIGNTNRIRVHIMKIEKTGLIRKTWKDLLSQNSGGEKFVSMFVLLSSLMSYMRKRETDIETREEKKVLIMDNPFAKTNAGYLLEPMFQIAEKYNIQLICFSGIGGSSVYNRFNRIYVAKVIEDKFRNKQNLTFAASAGADETLELSDFHITKEQLTLF